MEEKMINTTCGYCSTGCNMTVHLAGGSVLKVDANPDYPVNRGKACAKGFQFLGHLNAPDRAVTPLIRTKAGELEAVSWDRALQLFVERFRGIQERNGREAVAFINTGQMTNEEFAFLGSLAKFGMGMIHGDGNTRQCMATAVVAYQQSFGFDAPPFTYGDFEESDLLIFFGSNPAIAHPIMWGRVAKRKDVPRVFVFDPRKTETAKNRLCTHFVISPKSDLVLLYALANILIQRGWVDSEFIDKHTAGFQELKSRVGRFTAEMAAEVTGLSSLQISGVAEAIHQSERVSFWWMVGINQGHQAVRTAEGIINLALLTGNIGRPGTGANSITGQCNAMGSRLFSNTSKLLGGRDFASERDRAEVAQILGISSDLIPDRHSLPYDGIVDAIDEGRIRGLWIVCTNPAHSWINSSRLAGTLEKLDFLVVQDMFFTTETARMASLILPAGGCGEKDGTFINSERRFGLVQKVLAPPGEALPNFEIFRRVADSWGCGEMFREWSSPAKVFEILKRLSEGQPWDITGISDYAMIDGQGGIQWPYPSGAPPVESERRLFGDGRFFHRDGRARFFFEEITDVPEKTTEEFPFILLTGRGSVSQWHTRTRTDKAPLLKRMSPGDVYLEICEEDAKRLGVGNDELVAVRSPRGEVRAKAKVCDSVQPGQVFMAMHYSETNVLTFPAFDTYSRQPSYKYSAVSVGPVGGMER